MFNGYTISHPTAGTGLAKWQQDPGKATTPSAQDLADGSVSAPPAAGTGGSTYTAPPAAPPARPAETPAMRAAKIAASRRPAAPVGISAGPAGAPPPAQTRPGYTIPTTQPGADPYHPPGYTPGVAASPAGPASLAPPPPVENPFGLHSLGVNEGGGIPMQEGFIANGQQSARAPLNIDGTALNGGQLAALAGTGLPGDPFTGGFTPDGGWNANNGGRGAADQAAAVAAYKAQYGSPGVTLDQVKTQTSNSQDQLEAARRLQQEYQDSVGRFL